MTRVEQITRDLLRDAQSEMDREGRSDEPVSRQLLGLAVAVARQIEILERNIDLRFRTMSGLLP